MYCLLGIFLYICRQILLVTQFIAYEKNYIMDDDCNPYLQSSDVYIVLF